MWNMLSQNRYCNKKDKFKEYQGFCERIAMIKSTCHPEPPKEYPFLKIRAKKKMDEKGIVNIIYNLYRKTK